MKPFIALLPLSMVKAQNNPETFEVFCPKLECNPDEIKKNLLPGECFSMGTEVVQDPIYARDCFDETE